ncbi:hypothetical protein, partial [Streptomyces bohaiensis]|uniref:hypothetical protein n=1 Tax=Streptomyces bohaiensis TaxID=1431344 RepID=UPI0030C6CD23
GEAEEEQRDVGPGEGEEPRAVALRLFAAAGLFALAGADIPLLLLGLTGTWLFLVTANRRTA